MSHANQELEAQLLEALKRLEKATENVIKTRGYAGDAKKMKFLVELIKEQIRHEDTVSTASPVR
jgi:ferritin